MTKNLPPQEKDYLTTQRHKLFIKVSVVVVIFSFGFFACNSNESQNTENTEKPDTENVKTEKVKAENAEVGSITQIISPFFDSIPAKYSLLLLRNHDCLACEKSTASYVGFLSDEKQEDVFIIAQEIRQIEKKKFYNEKPYLKNTNHIFSDSLKKVICKKLNLELLSTILIEVENDSILYAGLLKEKTYRY